MRIVVLGAGLIGVLTAYYLAKDGHEVVVVDRQADVGLETSFANGALITPSTSDSWAAPGTPQKILKWLGREDAPLLLRPSAIPGHRGLGSAPSSRIAEPIAGAPIPKPCSGWRSIPCSELHALLAESAIDFDRNKPGLLKLFRDPLSMASARRAGALYAELGIDTRLLSPEACVEIEPALAPIGHQISGGMFYPADESGDSWKFVKAIADLCRARGVDFRLSTGIRELSTKAGRITGHRHRQGAAHGRGLRSGTGQLQRRPRPQPRLPPADLSGQGLFHHRRGGRLECRALAFPSPMTAARWR